ncbi:MAG: class I SAM-dependent methyltransferase [Candidatus Lokiarchaeota archaeon]|nr:class I SAM-dependent methyltransferase [Candidatus Lokiarchaeota archaeon]
MPDWDDIFNEKGKVFLEPHPEMARISELLKAKGAKRILDLGCGSGRHLLFFLKKGFEVYGMDASPRGISIAEQWLLEENLKADIKLHRMEEKFPYEDNFFDAIISIQVIHHNKMKEILITISEIVRILRKGGIIFITFPRFGEIWNETSDLKEIEKGTYIPQKGKEKGLPHHFFTVEEIQDVFSSFNLLEIYNDRKNHRAILGIKK